MVGMRTAVLRTFPRLKSVKPSDFRRSLLSNCRDWIISTHHCGLRKTEIRSDTWFGGAYPRTCCRRPRYQNETIGVIVSCWSYDCWKRSPLTDAVNLQFAACAGRPSVQQIANVFWNGLYRSSWLYSKLRYAKFTDLVNLVHLSVLSPKRFGASCTPPSGIFRCFYLMIYTSL